MTSVDPRGLTSGQEPTASRQPTGAQGASYSVQAADAGDDERSGTDGGRGRPSPTTTDDDAHDGSMSLTDDPATLRAALKAARKEAAQNRTAAQELAALRHEQEAAKLSETEKLQKQIADLQRERDALTQQTQERVVRSELRVAAQALGLKPELALRLIDLAAVTFDDGGDPTNIRELLQQAIQDYDLATASSSAQPPSALSAGQPGVVARATTPQLGATNPSRNAQTAANRPIVRSVHDIQWRRS